MAARACSMCQVIPSWPHKYSKVCQSCKTLWDTIRRAMSKQNMIPHYKALKTKFPDEAELLWKDFVLASASRPQLDFMAWIIAKAPGVLRHLAQLDALAEQEQQCQPPLITPLLRRRARSTGASSSNGAAPAQPSDPDDSSSDTTDDDPTGSAEAVVVTTTTETSSTRTTTTARFSRNVRPRLYD